MRKIKMKLCLFFKFGWFFSINNLDTRFLKKMTTFLFILLGASSLTLETDDVIVQEDDSIMLNCTYLKRRYQMAETDRR